MANRTGLFVLGLALIAATTSAEVEVVEEERFDLVAQESEMSASGEGDLNISSFEWVTVYEYENPPLLIAAFEADADDIQPSALPSEAMIDDSLSVLPLPEEDRLATEQQQHQAP